MKTMLVFLVAAVSTQFVQAQRLDETRKIDPVRNRENIKIKLLEAKSILENDKGKLWGRQIWNDSIIVIDKDHNIHSLMKLANSKTDDHMLFYKTIEPNLLSLVNSTQPFEGGEFTTVLNTYLHDKSSTIIHELFHLLQFKYRKYKGDSIDYLDESEARILLRLEYQALRHAIQTIDENRALEEVKMHLSDAILFRELRQLQYASYLTDELELETLEGMANYTGLQLSTYENKYEKALKEIDEREKAKTYTRSFPYATGPAYGLIFDFLNISWRNGLDKIYNFAEIYNLNYKQPDSTLKSLESAKARNNYEEIFREERLREEKQTELIAYYTDLLIDQPTIKVAVTDFNKYSRSFNMYGTLSLKGIGLVYSSIKGTDGSGGENFGNFYTIAGRDQLGLGGILSYEKEGITYFVFPKAKTITENKISGDCYELELNPNWELIEYSDGNMAIVKK